MLFCSLILCFIFLFVGCPDLVNHSPVVTAIPSPKRKCFVTLQDSRKLSTFMSTFWCSMHETHNERIAFVRHSIVIISRRNREILPYSVCRYFSVLLKGLETSHCRLAIFTVGKHAGDFLASRDSMCLKPHSYWMTYITHWPNNNSYWTVDLSYF